MVDTNKLGGCTVWLEIFDGVCFADWGFFSVSQRLIFATKTHWFFSLRIIFAIFKKYPVPSIDNIFILVKYVQSGCNYRNTY